MSATTSLTQPSPQGEGFHVPRVIGKNSGGIGRMVSREYASKPRRSLLPGGEGQDEGGRQNTNSESFFKRSHQVIVALTVQEILDEQIAKKLV